METRKDTFTAIGCNTSRTRFFFQIIIRVVQDNFGMTSKQDDDRCPAGGESGAKKAKLSETHKLTYGNEVRRA